MLQRSVLKLTLSAIKRARIPLGAFTTVSSSTRWRGNATTSTVDKKLPLAGVRVLDMTRVLAGVGSNLGVNEACRIRI